MLLPAFTLTLTGATVGVGEGQSGYSGTLPNNPTHYLTIPKNASATLFSLNGLTNFSFYMGSPDTYNNMTFNLVGGGAQVFNGPQIWDGPNFAGDRTKGFRVYYDFNGAQVSSIQFESGSDAFEFDGLAGTVVPEPDTWALMILGFGGVGAMLRNRRRLVAA